MLAQPAMRAYVDALDMKRHLFVKSHGPFRLLLDYYRHMYVPKHK